MGVSSSESELAPFGRAFWGGEGRDWNWRRYERGFGWGDVCREGREAEMAVWGPRGDANAGRVWEEEDGRLDENDERLERV